MLKIAVLSDIHGNYTALQKCLDYAVNIGVDTFIFLGDYLGELAYPQKTMDILYSIKEKKTCFFIKGNKEDYWLNYEKDPNGWKEYDSTTGCLYYTYQNLKQKDIQFFKSLLLKEELKFNGLLPITICHGSPRKTNEKLLPGNDNTFQIIENNPSNYILCGHTHKQGKIKHNEKIALNAGSVGVPLDSNGKAQFIILKGTPDIWDYEFISIEYDVEKVVADLHSSGLNKKAPYWCKVSENLLRTGTIPHSMVLARAMAICKDNFGECIWPNIPEECWEQAVRELLPE
ncbi:MAG: metallophosphoesterase family protein [Lachnospiraceae bacterium]|nr:metallophosphoesterase family protein [Lachnospiraceae bacterium]